jgi:hypothetical protein
MLITTAVGAYTGLITFGAGVYAQRYMHARVVGGSHLLKIVPRLTEKYWRLIRAGEAPLWPLILCWVCIPLGVIVAFASVLLSPPLR